MADAKFCPQCGVALEPGVQFCSKCGATVKAEVVAKQEGAFRRILLILGIVLAVFIGLIVLVLFFAFASTSGLVNTVEGQLEAIRAGDAAKAYSYTAKEFQAETPLEEFTTFIETVPAMKENVSASFPNRQFQNDQGTVRATLTSSDGTQTTVDYALAKENGQWRIVNIHVLPPLNPPKENN